MGWLTRAGVLLALALIAASARAQETAVRAIGSRLELFVDTWLTERLDGLSYRLHEPRPAPPPASPIRGYYMTVVRDGDLYRAWYRDYVPGWTGPTSDGNRGELTCYAESRDGQEWTLPKLGLHEINGSRDNNAVLADNPPFCHNFSPFLDTRPGVPADQRFKALAGVHTSGLWAFASADGIHWRKLGEQPVLTSAAFAFDSQNVAFWSETEGCYVCYFRSWDTPLGKLRSISRATSADFVSWSAPVATNPNLPGEHLYTSNTQPYFRAPHLYIALPTRFMPDRGSSTDILLMTSRDGSHYDRLLTEAFIRPGLAPERWGNRANYAALGVVPTGPDEMSIYHAPGGLRYTLRTDGFVSINAPARGGELLTRPLTFSGRELVINYSTSAAGRLQVEIQSADGTPLPGYALADCPPLVGDRIEQVVAWKAGADVSRLAGRPVRLRFAMAEADLYSLRFR